MIFTQDGDSLVADGHEWMQALRFPYFTIAKIREMKIGEELSMFAFDGPSRLKDDFSRAEATIKRLRGKWQIEVFWMLHIGKRQRRGDIWSWCYFKLEPSSVIRILPESSENVNHLILCEKITRRVCRLAHRLSKMAEKAGDRQSMVEMWAVPRRYDEGRAVPYAVFLDTIAAPPMSLRSKTKVKKPTNKAQATCETA